MPYIKTDRRVEIFQDGQIDAFEIQNAGDLNYAITELVSCYLRKNATINYQVLNDIKGALDGAKDEFTRRIIEPYEDAKIKENGDVY